MNDSNEHTESFLSKVEKHYQIVLENTVRALGVFTVLFLVFGVKDWGNFSSEISAYGIECGSDLVSGHCTGVAWANDAKTFKVNVDDSSVIEKTFIDGPERLTNCGVADLDNWKCTFSDGSGPLGFNEGNFFENWDKSDPTQNILFGKTVYVPRYRWVIFKWTGLLKP